MAFDPNESEQITLTEATQWTANFRNTIPAYEVRAHGFGKNKLNSILNQDNCVGIRAYYAIDDEGAKQLVLVGIDTDGQDLYNGVILDRSAPCPNSCDTGSPLT